MDDSYTLDAVRFSSQIFAAALIVYWNTVTEPDWLLETAKEGEAK